MPQEEKEKIDPNELTPKNVMYVSEHWKKIVIEKRDIEKGMKALNFLENNLVEYVKKEDSEIKKGYYTCGTNKIIDFKCSCGKEECEHILALYLQLKIWNWNKKNLKTSITTI